MFSVKDSLFSRVEVNDDLMIGSSNNIHPFWDIPQVMTTSNGPIGILGLDKYNRMQDRRSVESIILFSFSTE